jgi:ABC-type antimicrobial peptide transport system permease subunit
MIGRQWRSSPSYSLINLGGLTAGLAVTLLIGLWINDELSFDHYFTNHPRLARLMDTQPSGTGVSTGELLPPPLAAELRTREGRFFKHLALVFPNFPHVLAAGEKKITAAGQWAQPDWPEMLSLKMIRGRRDALKDPSSALIDQSTAIALFGSTGSASFTSPGSAARFDPANAMGRIIRIDNIIEIKVAGIYEDLPANTSFAGTHILLSWDKAANEMSWMAGIETHWDAAGFWLFVELNNPADPTNSTSPTNPADPTSPTGPASSADIAAVNASIKDILKQHIKGSKDQLSLHPMDRWHLYSEFRDGNSISGRIRIVRLFTIIGIFVLLLACINFMNLSTARSERRAREVGIRKTLGSLRRQLIGQFLAESVLMAFLASILAIAIATLSLPLFNRLAAKDISIPWNHPAFWLTALGITLFTGLIAGSYPALYLSRFQPVKVLKGTFRTGPFAAHSRKFLVVLQFTVSVSLIIGTIVIYRQIQYTKARPVGYTREGLLTIRMNTGDIYAAPYTALRDDLLRTGAVEDMAQSGHSITEMPPHLDDISWEGKDPASTPPITIVDITHDYGHTMDWQIAAGRDFSRTFATDTNSLILNESAARLIGWKDPVGKTIRVWGMDFRIVGVVKDMVMGSPYQPVPATIFHLDYHDVNYIDIRVNPSIPMSTALNKIAAVFRKYNPAAPFEFRFIVDDYALKFAGEQQVAGLSTFFATLAIFISCLGLFGLASYMAEQRTKEIAIRKVLGAKTSAIIALLSADFLKLILIALAIAIPLSGWAMHQWLQSYTYRTPLSAWIFAGAAFIILSIAMFTVSFQALRAALANPVRSLRSQ